MLKPVLPMQKIYHVSEKNNKKKKTSSTFLCAEVHCLILFVIPWINEWLPCFLCVFPTDRCLFFNDPHLTKVQPRIAELLEIHVGGQVLHPGRHGEMRFAKAHSWQNKSKKTCKNQEGKKQNLPTKNRAVAKIDANWSFCGRTNKRSCSPSKTQNCSTWTHTITVGLEKELYQLHPQNLLAETPWFFGNVAINWRKIPAATGATPACWPHTNTRASGKKNMFQAQAVYINIVTPKMSTTWVCIRTTINHHGTSRKWWSSILVSSLWPWQ